MKCFPHGWWIFTSTSSAKDFAHWQQGNALWLSSCLRRVPLWVNYLSHILHWNNFSPVWMAWCCFKTFAALKCFPQLSQISLICFCWYFSSLKDFSHWSQEYEEFCALLYASKDHLFWKMICHINSMDFWVDRIWLDAFLDHSELCNIFHMIYKIYHCAVVCGFLIQFHAGKIFHTYHMNEPCVSTP